MSIDPEARFVTLAEILRARAVEEPDRVAFTFLRTGDDEERRITYAQLDAAARSIAAVLQRQRGAGARALILLPSGIPYITSFFGCLYAGVIAVPSYPPRRHADRVCVVAEDCEAQFALTTRDFAAAAERALSAAPAGRRVRIVAVDGIDPALAGDVAPVQAGPDDLAFLQYTSGSTSRPKGVMVSHGNLHHNIMTRTFRGSRDSVLVSWLPLFHDMGLIAVVLHAVFAGMHCVLMSPAAFVQQPVRWLRAISRYRGTVSAAPNFGYELCLSRITPQQRATLDLSSWSVAFNGAEPVRPDTLERFARTFAPQGFRASALLPVYGLAEATVGVTVGPSDAIGSIATVDASSLQQHRIAPADGDRAARRLVSCGPSGRPDLEIAIVNPATAVRSGTDEVGEVWVKGPSVAQGYWGRPEETAATFHARLAGSGNGPYLRTGDLGFVKDGGLFVTGRIKDLIVVRGWNHYPQDLELTAEHSHEALRAESCAAFGVEIDGEERAVIVQELAPGIDDPETHQDIIAAIRRAIAREHELNVHAVVLVPPRALPRTTSGKSQRAACRAAFLDQRLPMLAEWVDAASIAAPDAGHAEAEALEDWMIRRIAAERRVPAEAISPEALFADLGLDSAAVIALTGDLEKRLGRRIPPTVVFEFPCVRALAHHLTGYHSGEAAWSAGPGAAEAMREPIAVIGLACRFPGADGPDAYWRLLESGREAIVPIPSSRWRVDDYYDPDPAAPGKMSSERGGFLDNVDGFDPLFFGISPREAAYMDPQQRLLLELSWEALEDAGQVVDRLARSRTGVFVGISTTDYGQLQFEDPASIGAHSNTGCSPAIAANRISYVFDFRGPSLAIDTACSSSLAAVHLACRSLWAGEATLALAGGANVVLSPAATIGATKLMALAPDGRCKAFDARANGYVRGEGAGMIVLKPLRQALADRDPIHALIRSTALNQDGRSNGLTAPNVAAQEALLREAYEAAGIPPARVDYVEAHGTGTFLGDPIEAKALGSVLSEGRPAERPCLIGSVKTNIGHLEAAAGIAGLIKTVLALRKAKIPPSLHFTEPNPHIAFETLKLAVARTLTEWPAGPWPRIAGVSSFGFGGTNAHVVLEGAPRLDRTAEPDVPTAATILPLSARGPEALRSLARITGALLASTTDAQRPLLDICFTAAVRRAHHGHRLAVVGASRAEMCAALEAFERGDAAPGLSVAVEPRRTAWTDTACRRRGPVFVFSGQGSQWPEMGRQLFHAEPPFREAIVRCGEIMRQYVDWSLEEMIGAEPHPRANDVDVVQPLIFAVQVALVALLKARGVEPAAVVGHSMGETAAAFCAGALSLDDAALIVCRRSQRAKTAQPGAMVLVDLPHDALRRMIEDGEPMWIAANNSPRSTVVTGDPEALRRLVARLDATHTFSRWIAVGFAAHSPWVDELASELTGDLVSIRPQSASIPFYSSVTGGDAATLTLDPDYWSSNLRQPVLFAQAIEQMLADGYDTFVEISPHPILAVPVQECARAAGTPAVIVPTLRRGAPEQAALLECLAALYVHGHDLAFEHLFAGRRRTCVPLPAYPWQRQRCWMERADAAGDRWPRRADRRGDPLIGRCVESSLHPDTRLWDIDADAVHARYAAEHIVRDAGVLPAAAYIDIVMQVAAEIADAATLSVVEMSFERPFTFDGDVRALQLAATCDAAGTTSFRFSSRPQGPRSTLWTAHASARLDAPDRPVPTIAVEAPDDVRARCRRVVDGADHYQQLADRGVMCGPAFRRVAEIACGDREALGRLTVARPNSADDTSPIDAATLDACLQIVGAAALTAARADGELYVPSAIDVLRWSRIEGSGEDLWCHATVADGSHADGGAVGTFVLTTAAGDVLIEARGVRLRAVERLTAQAESPWLHEIRWERLPWTASANGAGAAGVWIVFADATGVGAHLQRHLENAGASAITISAGDPEYRRLVRNAAGPGGSGCRGIVYLWSLDQSAAVDAGAASLENCTQALEVMRAVVGADWKATPRMWLATRGAQMVAGGDRVAPASSALWGLGRALMHEHPEHRCALVDVDPHDDAHATARQLAREISHDTGENQVAYRGGDRFAARLVELDRQLVPRGQRRPAITGHGTYVVTGGLGSLGLRCARWMAEQGARRLVLIGRSEPSAAARAGVAGIAQLGTEVLIGHADVADEAALLACLRSFDDPRHPVRGIVHAAGVLDDAPLRALDVAGLERVIGPKARGAWNLHRFSLDQPVDLFVLFSSAVAILGSPGQGNYAAASAFLDGLAHARSAGGLPAVSINWGPWSQVGLASAPDRIRFVSAHGVTPITPERGVALLAEALDAGRTQVVAINFDPRARSERSARLARWPLLSRLAGADGNGHGSGSSREPAGEVRRTILALPFGIARMAAMQAHVQNHIARVLRVPVSQIDADMPLRTLGLDSMMAVELRDHLEASLGVTLSATVVWSYPTLQQLAVNLLERIDPAAPSPDQPITSPAAAFVADEFAGLTEDQLASLLSTDLRALDERV